MIGFSIVGGIINEEVTSLSANSSGNSKFTCSCTRFLRVAFIFGCCFVCKVDKYSKEELNSLSKVEYNYSNKLVSILY